MTEEITQDFVDMQRQGIPMEKAFFNKNLPVAFVPHPSFMGNKSGSPSSLRSGKYFEMAVVTSGRACIAPVGGENVMLSTGDALLTGVSTCKTVHRLDGDTQILNCLIKPPFFDPYSLERIGNATLLTYLNQSAAGALDARESLLLHGLGEGSIAPVMDAALAYYGGNAPHFGRCAFLILLLLADYARSGIETIDAQEAGSQTARIVAQIENYVNTHLREPNLDELAACLGYSRTYTSSMVKQLTGRTLSDHVREMRLSESKRLLQKTELSVEEIAFLVGFPDRSYFHRVFRSAMGQSPADYRRQHRQVP